MIILLKNSVCHYPYLWQYSWRITLEASMNNSSQFSLNNYSVPFANTTEGAFLHFLLWVLFYKSHTLWRYWKGYAISKSHLVTIVELSTIEDQFGILQWVYCKLRKIVQKSMAKTYTYIFFTSSLDFSNTMNLCLNYRAIRSGWRSRDILLDMHFLLLSFFFLDVFLQI